MTTSRGRMWDYLRIYLTVWGSIVVAGVIGYRSALHGVLGGIVLASMALQCWTAHFRGKSPAYEFLRMAHYNALNAGDAADRAYSEEHTPAEPLNGKLTYEQRERDRHFARARAAYSQALIDAQAARDSEFECVQNVGSKLEAKLRELAPEQFENRGWSLYCLDDLINTSNPDADEMSAE